MKLARPALTHAQYRAYFAQAEFPRVAQAHYGPVAIREACDFLIENRRSFIVGKQTMRLRWPTSTD